MNTQTVKHDQHVTKFYSVCAEAQRAVQCVSKHIGVTVEYHGGRWWELDTMDCRRAQFPLSYIWEWVSSPTDDGWIDLMYYILNRYEDVPTS